jgi:hypothetical protein
LMPTYPPVAQLDKVLPQVRIRSRECAPQLGESAIATFPR